MSKFITLSRFNAIIVSFIIILLLVVHCLSLSADLRYSYRLYHEIRQLVLIAFVNTCLFRHSMIKHNNPTANSTLVKRKNYWNMSKSWPSEFNLGLRKENWDDTIETESIRPFFFTKSCRHMFENLLIYPVMIWPGISSLYFFSRSLDSSDESAS